jgi:hypothetical protein
VFTNVGQSTCTVSGYPVVAALDAQGNQIEQAVHHEIGMMGLPNDSSPVPLVTLAPGQVASAEIEGSDLPPRTASTCVGYPSFLVTPPGETHSVRGSPNSQRLLRRIPRLLLHQRQSSGTWCHWTLPMTQIHPVISKLFAHAVHGQATIASTTSQFGRY